MSWQRLLTLVLAVQPGGLKQASAFRDFNNSSTSQLRVNEYVELCPAGFSSYSVPDPLFEGCIRHQAGMRSWRCLLEATYLLREDSIFYP